MFLNLLKLTFCNQNLPTDLYLAEEAINNYFSNCGALIMSVEIFEHINFSGRTSGSLDRDYSYIGDFWNDKISSIKVYSDTWEFFEHANFKGRSFRLRPGKYPKLTNHWNDVISSFKQVRQGTIPVGGRVVQRILDLTNIERRRVGYPALSLNSQLIAAAQAHSEKMARHNQLKHQLPGELKLGDRISQAGYRWSAVAENIGWNYQTPEDAIEGWMKSPGHRKNLLNPKYKELGVGYSKTYWTQNFAAR